MSVLVERCRVCVVQALAEVPTLPSPAFALCLFTPQESHPLAPDNIALGLERDRERERSSRSPYRAFVEVWNPTNYEYISLDRFDDPSGEPEFDRASEQVTEWAAEAGIPDPAAWVLEEAARALTLTPPLKPVTQDFVCWVLDEGPDFTERLKWIAPAGIQRELAAKQLLPDDYRKLDGYAHHNWSDEP